MADTGALLDVISGFDRGAWYNAPGPLRPFAEEVGADPEPLRIGLVTTAPFGLPVDAACVAAAEATATLLEGLGHRIEPATLDLPDEVIGWFLALVNSGLGDYVDVDWERTEPHIQAARKIAQDVDSLTYVHSVHQLQAFSRQFTGRWGSEFDVLLTPTMSIEPPVAGVVLEAAHAAPDGPALPVLQMAVFTSMFNVSGQPAISLPLHVAPSGLPIGVQLVGGPWEEARLLRLAGQLERAEPWADRRPPSA